MPSILQPLKVALADRYTIEREIGSGGMALVYLAEDVKHRRKVAVKVLRPELAAVLGLERFLAEIEVTANLQHPHILPLYDSGEVDGFLFYVMPFVEGESLREKLTRETQLPVEEALKIASDVADALGSAHKRGVIHRDIKPENILLGEGHALVADFGIALAVKAAGGDRLTETGLSLGTPSYMSPEQVAGEQQIDGRADIYSLGCVLFEMLVGEPPFTGPNAQVVLARHLAATVPSVTAARSAIPRPVSAAIERALAKAPVDRFETAVAFSDALFGEVVEAAPKSIAVLPFANMSADPENEYFSDGISEEIINALTKLRGLRVAARTSSFTFKGQTPSIQEVGAKLRVATVLEGSVRKAGNRLRITVQLIKVDDGYHLWSERYDREMTDVFAIQDEIAATVVEKLKVSLLGAPEVGVRQGHTDDLEAYELYLRGRYFWNQRAAGVLLGLDFFQRALERDPSYALAHAGVANASALIGFWSATRRHEAYRKGKAAALRALELNPNLAETHSCRGLIAFWYDWDWALAEREVLRAIELNPQEVDAHYWYALQLSWIKGEWGAAIQRFRHAHDLDPLSVSVMAQIGGHLIFWDRPEEGLVELEKALELDPGFYLAHWFRGIGYRRLARYEEATAAFERAISLTGGMMVGLADLAYTHVKAGRLEEARAILEDGVLGVEQPAIVAKVYHGLGESDTAFELLEKAYQQRDPNLVLAVRDSEAEFLREDHRGRDLVRRMGLS